MEFVHRSWLAIHEDLYSALVEFALSKQTHSLGGSNIHGRPRHERHSAALHLRDSDGRNRRCCRDRRRPGHPGLQISDRQRLPVDGEHETRRHVDLPRALGQSDDEIVPVHSDDFELLDLSGRSGLRRRDAGGQDYQHAGEHETRTWHGGLLPSQFGSGGEYRHARGLCACRLLLDSFFRTPRVRAGVVPWQCTASVGPLLLT